MIIITGQSLGDIEGKRLASARRAISATLAPGSQAAAISALFCSSVHTSAVPRPRSPSLVSSHQRYVSRSPTPGKAASTGSTGGVQGRVTKAAGSEAPAGKPKRAVRQPKVS
jgi:hypothetical protein